MDPLAGADGEGGWGDDLEEAGGGWGDDDDAWGDDDGGWDTPAPKL